MLNINSIDSPSSASSTGGPHFPNSNNSNVNSSGRLTAKELVVSDAKKRRKTASFWRAVTDSVEDGHTTTVKMRCGIVLKFSNKTGSSNINKHFVACNICNPDPPALSDLDLVGTDVLPLSEHAPVRPRVAPKKRKYERVNLPLGATLSSILPPHHREEVMVWLEDDCPTTDIGGFVVGDKSESANLYCKSSCVLAGVPYAQAAFEAMEVNCNWLVQEGTYIDVASSENNKVLVAVANGKCRNILLAERVALNILSRASGIATEARNANKVKESKNWHGYVAGTRKTTPGFKNVEKYALLVGGVATHRMDLSQMVMLKDNHIWSAGSITDAVKLAKRAAGFSIKIEVVCVEIIGRIFTFYYPLVHL